MTGESLHSWLDPIDSKRLTLGCRLTDKPTRDGARLQLSPQTRSALLVRQTQRRAPTTHRHVIYAQSSDDAICLIGWFGKNLIGFNDARRKPMIGGPQH